MSRKRALDAAQTARAKHLLLNTTVPISQLAKRFGVSVSCMCELSRSLGLTLKSRTGDESFRGRHE